MQPAFAQSLTRSSVFSRSSPFTAEPDQDRLHLRVPNRPSGTRDPRGSYGGPRLLAANFDGWTAAIEACLESARDRLPPDLDRASLSQFVLT